MENNDLYLSILEVVRTVQLGQYADEAIAELTVIVRKYGERPVMENSVEAAANFLKSKIGHYNSSHPFMQKDVDYEDIEQWLREYASQVNPKMIEVSNDEIEKEFPTQPIFEPAIIDREAKNMNKLRQAGAKWMRSKMIPQNP